ncbi:group II intron reverse transcriptase/maturase [Granulosicoccus sp. 3-233]|uniref:group II intron reverse transcriptase/maturase n=1 Tax=Granulosicoccus sp. 3-233 TaxID=3417969 RepID=UPI003D34FE67
MGKDVTEVRSLQRKHTPDTVGLEERVQTSLQGIAMRAASCKDHRFQNLYRLLNEELLLDCWRKLNKHAASGVDEVTAQAYEENLYANIENLVRRLKSKCYRAKLVRRCYIPKANGKLRALGIPALEDKLVQRACARILTAIYEQDFLNVSYGYRPQRSARDALDDLGFNLQYGSFGYVVEADIKGYFDMIDHDWLLQMLEQRVEDKAFTGLIRRWLKAGILDTDGEIIHPESGSPQGGSVSPILANVYLHYVLDLWFDRVVKPRCKGYAFMIRYADDYVCAFQYKSDAKRFYRAMPKRLEKFNLVVAPEKTKLSRFSRFSPGLVNRFEFLSMEFYWDADWYGEIRVKKRTAPKRLQAAKRKMKEWVRKNRHLNGKPFIAGLNRRLVGHYNYFGLRTNGKALESFYRFTIGCVFKWLNRRGGKKRSFNWGQFKEALKKWSVAKPNIVGRQREHAILV